jgi:predicted RND superfamily exporter protein
MAYEATQVQLSYQLAKMLPSNDSANIKYEQFKKMFGEDGNVITIGIKSDKLFQKDQFNGLYELCTDVKNMPGVEEVVSIVRTIEIFKNDSLQKFEFKNIMEAPAKTQAEVDSIKNKVLSMPFYDGLLFNKKEGVYLVLVTLDKHKLNDKSRESLIMDIKARVDRYQATYNPELHFSGLPYIRTLTTQKVKGELVLFILISLLIAIIIMLIFFKSLRVVLSSLVLVIFSVIWTFGTLALFDYKITILTGVIPSLLIIIAIENCIFLINKYQWEYKTHGNKVKSLSRVVQRIGFATFMTNATTAVGFATFIFTSNAMLKEFGVVASINVMVEYVMSIMLIPIIFSYLPPPTDRQLKHLEGRRLGFVIDTIKKIVFTKRKWVYAITILLVLGCIYGVTKMRTSGKLVDDIKHSDPIYVDLKFFEKNFGGVMPFEISIDTRKKNGVMRLSTIYKIEQVQKELAKYPQFSKPLSLAEFSKFAKQSFYNGDPAFYDIPNENEKVFIFSYLPTKVNRGKNMLRTFVDSTKRYTRISVQMADVGTKEMKMLEDSLRPKIDSIFKPDKYTVTLTGNSVVYTKGTDFLIGNLWESVIFGIIAISILIAMVFRSSRMVILAIICNLIPLLITAAIMGYGKIPVKPSTLIVFSVALGIAIDNAILFLAKFKNEMMFTGGDLKLSVANALDEAGISMIYSAIVLVVGFGVFVFSAFGGTQALGMLISYTLLFALFFNIIVLPSLVMTFKKF